MKNKNFICIMDHLKGEFFVSKCLDAAGHKILKIVDTCLYGDYIVLPYEYESPLVERFNNGNNYRIWFSEALEKFTI